MFLLTPLDLRPEPTDVLRLDVPADRFELLVVLAPLRLPFKLFLRFAPALCGAPAEGARLGVLARRRADGREEFLPALELARLDSVSEPLAEGEDMRVR